MDPKPHAPHHKTAGEPLHPFVHFAFYRVDSSWRKLLPNERVVAKQEFLSVFEPFYKKMLVSSYSTLGLRADCDLLIWRIGPSLEALQDMTAKMLSVGAGRYLQSTHAYLGMAAGPVEAETLSHRRRDAPGHHHYLCVQPVGKTPDWHELPAAEKTKLAEEENRIFAGFSDMHVHSVYSMGLDDQDQILAAETDKPAELVALGKALRGSKSARYNLNDRPTFSCIRKDLGDILDQLG